MSKMLARRKSPSSDQVKRLWDKKANEWEIQVGKHGDNNRRLNSDPVLWKMLGPVKGRKVLDAGCGTGYLSLKLAAKGAKALGVDHSSEMIKLARARIVRGNGSAEFGVSYLEKLKGVKAGSFDLAVSNYVLMDVKGLEGALGQVYRALRPGGIFVCIILHPCFDHGMARLKEGGASYTWKQPYFERHEYWETWGHFRSPFVSFHRSLSDYWRAFHKAGFTVEDFQEPVVAAGNRKGDKETIRRLRWTPFSVAFKLKKMK